MTFAIALCRAVVLLFWLVTSAYAFLGSVPFVSEHFIGPGMVPALVTFARWHGWLTLGAAVLAGVGAWHDMSTRGTYLSSGGLLWLLVMAGAAAVVLNPLASIEPGATALLLSLGALVPVWWLVGLDFAQTRWPETVRAGDLMGRDAVIALAGAMAVSALYAVMAVVSTGSIDWLGGVQSVAGHTLLFMAILAAVVAVRALADLTSKPAPWEALSAAALLMGLIAAALVLVVPAAVGVRDRESRAVIVIFGATVGAVLAARGLRAGREPHRDGLALVMSGLLPAWATREDTRSRVIWAGVVLATAVGLRLAANVMDWNFAAAKLGAIVVWFLVLATTVNWAPTRVYLPPYAPFASSLVVLVAYLAAAGRLPFGPVSLEAATASSDTWVIGDPSYRTLRDWLHRAVPTDATEANADPTGGPAFFDFLQMHTNIGRSIPVSPVPVQLAPLEGPPAARRPHIFLFAIDSLRRDYLSPYNPGVAFTPAVQKFAAESAVYTKVFTRYGATGLSVPSMWVGGMLLHKQYVLPFAPMNSLHALLAHHRYARQMSIDNIVEVITPPDKLDELNKGVGVAEFRLCRTLDELRGRLDTIAAGAEPTFTWNLSQDIHVAAINREGNKPVDTLDYGAYHAPYASRIRRFDACFGAFVDDLKAHGLFDESLIVLTSDHGDSLGEEGRWGHAYTIYPEIVQVPLIVHMPASMRDRFATNPAAPAFTADITPTIYALLGHTQTADAPIFGRPLVWPKGAAAPTRPPFGLVASSYGSVYGWIDDRGSQMYIADGVALRDYVYELDGSPAGRSVPVTAAVRAAGQKAIRRGIQDIADYYRFTPPSP